MPIGKNVQLGGKVRFFHPDQSIFMTLSEGLVLTPGTLPMPGQRALLFLGYIDALWRSEGTADEMGHWCELGALCHDALAVKYGRQHTSNAACAWLLDGRGSLRTGQSHPALLTVLIPDRNLSIPRRSNLASGAAAPGGTRRLISRRRTSSVLK